jgi:transposase InsO family protein
MKQLHPMALFRLTVLGPLINRDRLGYGELKRIIRELAEKPYAIPGSHRCYLSEKTIEAWYYQYRHEQIDGLTPKRRRDRGQSKLPIELQEAILQTKRDNPKRSLNEIIRLLNEQGLTAHDALKRSSVHRLLQQHGLSNRGEHHTVGEEYRSFEAEHCGDIWYGDVMHGPRVVIKGQLRKAYLVSLMDDASRLITHTAFCPGETAMDIEGVLKQALLKRGLPKKLVIDNGAAYRAKSLQQICARLSIQLIYCRPYRPQGKAKLERWHRVVRDQFLSELTDKHLGSLEGLNAYLWAWIETVYHQRSHSGLNDLSPLQRWQQELSMLRSLGPYATHLDELFHHRVQRKVRKDGTVSYRGQRFEVPYELSSRTVQLVVDPHGQQAISVESLDGEPLGQATPLDLIANNHRRRHRPVNTDVDSHPPPQTINAVDQAHQNYIDQFNLQTPDGQE